MRIKAFFKDSMMSKGLTRVEKVGRLPGGEKFKQSKIFIFNTKSVQERFRNCSLEVP
jgi:hypothetical protein